MNNDTLIQTTAEYVKTELQGAEGGHDWWHIERVWKLAQNIASQEEANMLVVSLGALLHDIADAKFHNGDEQAGVRKAKKFLQSENVPADITEHVLAIIMNISFKGGNTEKKFSSKELDIVQDADRLDAIGAIGIARTFNYGGFKNREIYNPGIPPQLNMTPEEYRKSTAPTINHFYEKLLLLKDRMNTTTARKMAEDRHHFMELFLAEFYAEWKGEK